MSRSSRSTLHLLAEPDRLLVLAARQARLPAGVDLRLVHPSADRRLGQVELTRHLGDRPIAPPAKLHHFRLEAVRERPPAPSLLHRLT
jgi:hypothetical protein